MGDVFTLADLLAATELLRRREVSRYSDCYVAFLHPRAVVDIQLMTLVASTYREWLLRDEVLRHERWREDLGRRGHVTAEEVLTRVEGILRGCRSST